MRTLTLLGALALAACNNTPEATPADSGPLVRDVVRVDATDATAPTDATDATALSDAPDAAAPVDVADASTIADSAPVDALTDASAPADADCAGDGGCYACPPIAPEHFLTRCTASACARFDNRTRLTRLLPDGGLPPLP